MNNKFTKVYETVLESQSLSELQEEIMSPEAWEGLGANNVNRTLNLIGMGGAAATTALGAAFPPAGAVASAVTNAYDTAVGTYQAADAAKETDPELKNRKTADSVWNFAGAVPLAGDAAQAVRFTKVAGTPIGNALAGLGRFMTSGKTQTTLGVGGMVGAQPLADKISPPPERKEQPTSQNSADQDFEMPFDDAFRAQKNLEMLAGIKNYSRVINPPTPTGFSSRQPLISHFERVGKGVERNLMEDPEIDLTDFFTPEEEEELKRINQERDSAAKAVDARAKYDIGPDDLGGKSTAPAAEAGALSDEKTLRGAAKDMNVRLIQPQVTVEVPKVQPQVTVEVPKGRNPFKGLAGLVAPVGVAAIAAGLGPLVYGRLSRDKSEPPPLGEKGAPNMSGDIQNAIERLQGVVGSAGQIAQYAPPGIGELGRRAAATLAGGR